MNRINEGTGLNITVYHSFHDEVNYYKQHIWRCNGRCRDNPPFYGWVKRSTNRKPQPADYWFAEHKRTCGGEFIKVSEPQKSKSKSKDKEDKSKNKKKKLKAIKEESQRDHKSWGCGKTIQQYFNEMKNE